MLTERLEYSVKCDPQDWAVDPSVETPFNIEAILGACPELYVAWKHRPFVLLRGDAGEVYIRYIGLTDANNA